MLSDYVKSADWAKEKHVPVIDCPETVEAGKPVAVTVTVGKEIPHPNVPGHFIAWASLHFVPAGAQLPVELARCEFSAHGAGTAEGAVPAVVTEPVLTAVFTPTVPGTLYATAYCNIHGLWESEKSFALK